MWLLVSWAHCSSTVKSSLADSEHLHDWLKKLTLLVPEVSPPSIKTFFFFMDRKYSSRVQLVIVKKLQIKVNSTCLY